MKNKLKAIIGIITGKLDYRENVVTVDEMSERLGNLVNKYYDDPLLVTYNVKVEKWSFASDKQIAYNLYVTYPNDAPVIVSVNMEDAFQKMEMYLKGLKDKSEPSKTKVEV